ncbi:MAG: VWA domain-containing protein [Clostridia bacterium]|nr:VWA domain-containing protein [Clostridia bacterium]
MCARGNGIYCVDIVMCIDATGSMSSIIDEVKSNALSLYSKFVDEMELQNKFVEALRVKIIAFRDFICDSNPMVESKFFELPEQAAELRTFLDGVEAIGGGDGPECALEAISVALNSNWTTEGYKRRHIIVVFSDAPTMTIGERAGCPNYPSDMPSDMKELSSRWEGTDQLYYGSYNFEAGRLLGFVPDDPSWRRLQSWNRTTLTYTAAKGCSDIEMDEIINTVVGSIKATTDE